MADPIKNHFPFIFYEHVDANKFEIYFCFMNVEGVGDHLKGKKEIE
jgi:hypothetical protein